MVPLRGGRWAALALLCVAQFVVVLDATIVAIALPEIRDDLGFSRAGLQWVVSAYTLVFGGSLLLAGRIADLWGRRRMFVAGLAVFSAASAACGLAGSPEALVGGRILQGLGAAGVAPAALSSLTAAFSGGNGRGRALAAWTASAAGGGAAGWVLGGLLTGALGWQWVFLVNVPVGLLGLALAPLLLAETRDENALRTLDLAGAATSTAGLTLLVYGLTRLETGGFAAAAVILALAGTLLGLFVVVERRVGHPLVPLRVFRSRRLVGANAVALSLTAATTPPMFLCTLYAQDVLGLAPAAAGLLFPPFNLAVIAGSVAGPWVASRLGTRLTMVAGLAAISGGSMLLVRLSASEGRLMLMVLSFTLMGAGLGAASVASTALGTAAAAPDEQGLASGLLNSAAQVGTALGLAVLIPLTAARAEALGGADPQAGALVAGYAWGFVGAVGFAALGAILALVLLGRGGAEVGIAEPGGLDRSSA